MSVAGFLGKRAGELDLKGGLRVGKVVGQAGGAVLEGGLSVEEGSGYGGTAGSAAEEEV